MKNITIKTIPHNIQRYDTAGDWIVKGDDIYIYVSELGDWRQNMLVAIHEMAEIMLCYDRGIQQKDVDAFDIRYEEERAALLHLPEDEPGDSKDAPYYWEHQVATIIERIMANELKVNWTDYNKTCMDMVYTPKLPS